MSKTQLNMFAAMRSTFQEQQELTVQSMNAYGSKYDHWVFAWSGGKDSTATLTFVLYLIESGQIKSPKKITVLLADTRLELTPLWMSTMLICDQLRNRSIRVDIVTAPIEERFFVYMFGKGVPPPSNTFRWCTPKLKIDPMMKHLERLYKSKNEKFLLITGVRQGESAARDGRISMSCGKDGAECGQGWYQLTAPDSICDKLAPILHWRVCSVWDWLKIFAPMAKYGAWKTEQVADSYGGDEAEEKNARTGCVGCNLASKDLSLLLTIKNPYWSYLAPLLRLRDMYAELKKPHNRLRKTELQIKKDGELAKNQNRMGPLTFEARLWGLQYIKDIETDINTIAEQEGKPTISLINTQEESAIRRMISNNTWPQGWDGTEKKGDEPFLQRFNDGSAQPDLFIDIV
ncbi:phosphoadenosine phosphosulfate reductase family protein [Sphingobacterium deserti]|uniref:Phosphoadenosine phosphosulfate reductase n=1 Tax=Sphingobacterium deserti TaxID=1229276 RepID=A0A0B8T4F6_9SPHI|nr:phosphoadenosine phosphosulfate reductase family protein [Sphingobacterium deserti]KGE14593.1 phosphoadenosine phosphosulfate reductase [Sphingobacterium deserti]